MVSVRPLDDQFEPEKVERIRSVQERLSVLEGRSDAPRYFVAETIRSLEAGVLLSALLAETALLELLVRIAVIDHRISVAHITSTFDRLKVAADIHRVVEENRALGFSALVKELEHVDMLSTAEAAELRRIYTAIRIPLQHAIVHRFNRSTIEPELGRLSDELGLTVLVGGHCFEDSIESQAIELLEEVCSGVELVFSRCAV